MYVASKTLRLAIVIVALVAATCGGAHRTRESVTASMPTASMPTADLVFLSGDVLTMDPLRPHATALAVRGQRILAVGSDAEIQALAREGTRVVDLAGGSLTPGLVDTHCHLYGLGKSLESVNLRNVSSPQRAAKLAADSAQSLDSGEWVVGRGWDQNLWKDSRFPDRSTLDALLPTRPVSLRRIDGHALWANSAALRLSGVDRNTSDPKGGAILRDAEGNPTGILIDNAMELVESKLPKPSRAAIRRRILAAAARASALGLTGVHDMGISDSVISVYRTLARDGLLSVRVYGFLAGDLDVVARLSERVPEVDRDGTQFFVLRAIKLYADGALGSRGAALLAPYSDAPNNSGLFITEARDLREAAIAVSKTGWQLGIHAIGDAANRAVLDAFEAATKTQAPERAKNLRFRVEHAQVLSPPDIPRFAKLGIIASMQPTHATSDMPWAEKRLGADRLLGAYAWRLLLDSGAHLASGSDFPVERVSPLLGIYAAVTRQDVHGEPFGGWLAKQRMTLQEAIASFTKEAAYASFEEEHRGLLRAGFVADLTVFDRKLEANKSLLAANVRMTVVGGQIKFEDSDVP